MDRKLLTERSKSIGSCKVPQLTVKEFGNFFKEVKPQTEQEMSNEQVQVVRRSSNMKKSFSKSPPVSSMKKLTAIPSIHGQKYKSPSPRAAVVSNNFAVAPRIGRDNSRIKNFANIIVKNSLKKIDLLELTNRKISPKNFSFKELKFAWRTQVGGHLGRSKEQNQDNFLLIPNFTNTSNSCLFGVMDGHGAHGHLVSGYLKSSLPSYLSPIATILTSKQSPSSLKSKIKSQLKTSFQELQASLLSSNSISTYLSGSTTTLIIIHNSLCVCSNLGDSRAILGRFDGSWSIASLSNDHKPSHYYEKKRILKAGGRVEACVDGQGNYAGPERVWMRSEMMPGLAVSRSFGDVIASSVGVISEPEIKFRELDGYDKFIIVASDGVWDVLKNIEAINIIAKYYDRGNIEKAADDLLDKCLQRWKKKGGSVDDVTFVILFIM